MKKNHFVRRWGWARLRDVFAVSNARRTGQCGVRRVIARASRRYFARAESVRTQQRARGPEDETDAGRYMDAAIQVAADTDDGPDAEQNLPDGRAVADEPPACTAAILALQNVITAVGGLILVTNVLAPQFCVLPEDPAQAYMLSTAVMMAGVGTVFQALVGTRLPIVQTVGFVYMASALSTMGLKRWRCPVDVDLFTMGPDARTAEWQDRVRNVQGAVIVVGVLQMFLGYCGLVGKALKYITPLTVVPTVCIVGLSVFEKGILLMSGNWTTAIATMGFLTLFSQYMRKIAIPVPTYSTTNGCAVVRLKMFAMFSILLSVGIVWISCIYMTYKNSLLPTDPANTESKSGLYHNAQTFRLPYPFQWGLPKFSLSSIVSMLPALFTSIVESVGSYYMCAKFSGLTLPPKNAVNRGIGVQGICSILAGLLGIGSGVGTSSENVGNIGITRVCSRKVVMYAGCMMIFISPFTKVIAVLISLPDPVLGAVTTVLLTLITTVALSNLQFVNINSIRNMFILGMSLFFGLALPKYVSTHEHFFNTKYETLNEIGFVYLSSGTFIGGLIGFILDNTIPDDDDDVLNSHIYSYHMTDNKFKSSIAIKNEKTYKISDRVYENINVLLSII